MNTPVKPSLTQVRDQQLLRDKVDTRSSSPMECHANTFTWSSSPKECHANTLQQHWPCSPFV